MENNPLNCWKPLKPIVPQHRDEICSSVMVAKVEKNQSDGTRLNPKCCNNGQSAAKLRTGEGSTTIPLWK